MITNTLKTAKLTPLADAAASLVITKADGSTSVCSFNTSTSVATLAAVPSLPSQTAKYFLAAPNAADGAPSFRAIVASDIPSLSYEPSFANLSYSKLPTGGGTWSNGGNLNFSGGGFGIDCTPSVKLHVAGFSSTEEMLRIETGGNAVFRVGVNNWDGFAILKNGSGAETISLNSNGSSYFNGGNVGIGCTPTESLSVNGALSLQHGNAQAIMHRGVVGGSYGISIQGNTNTTLNDTYPGASVSIGGGSLSDGYEGNLILTAYGGSTSDANRNYIDFRRRTGTNTTASSMRITSGGNVGIGCTPDNRLHVFRSSAGTVSSHSNAVITLESDATGYMQFLQPANGVGGIVFGDPDGIGQGQLYYNHTSEELCAVAGGSNGVKLTSGATAWASLSDRRFKKQITPMMDDALSRIALLKPSFFRYTEDSDDRQRRVGLIAQDVQLAVPEAVHEDKDGILSYRPTELIPLLVKAIQEQQTQIDDMKKKIKILEAK